MVDPEDLGLDSGRALRVKGSAGLRVPLDRDRLVALLRRISEICARSVPDDFAFVEAITPSATTSEGCVTTPFPIRSAANTIPGGGVGIPVVLGVMSGEDCTGEPLDSLGRGESRRYFSTPGLSVWSAF
nr:hypothetical protein [Actinomadura sp. KC06]